MTLAAVALFALGSIAYAQGAGGGSIGGAASGASAGATTGSTGSSTAGSGATASPGAVGTGSSTANNPTSMPGTSGAVGDDKIDRSNRTLVATTR